ncbi:pro-sigmaK processing inhibitor BofA family protein [Paenibacillus whitsoniae]|uniref:Pro-sigmaK processing inhibitor BofA n=1 Tax=Paenibacillus whitsoniae TaxID=2496558 RepID=A0A430JF48_9BACL|nr:pro-sigmaK processing inhibitor BofA family protein [Paenibacillus whitsoniae]RTE09648.1 pro-sigmaK processing inhibitor BofA [Paenibacillus whitsoniae]
MVVKVAIWGVLILSSLLLVMTVFRSRGGTRVLASLGVNVVVAAFLLYLLNLLSGYTHIELPINTATLGTATVLGVPGVLLLIGVKVVLL